MRSRCIKNMNDSVNTEGLPLRWWLFLQYLPGISFFKVKRIGSTIDLRVAREKLAIATDENPRRK